MKILMVNKFLFPAGGTETYMMSLGKELVRRGNQVEYFGMEHSGNCCTNSENLYTSDMDFHTKNPIKKISYSAKTIYSSESKKKLKTLLNSFNPDVVHINNFNFQLTPSIIYAIREYEKERNSKIKIVYTAHDYQLICPNHMMNIPSTMENCDRCISNGYKECIKNKCIHSSLVKSALGAAEGYIYNKKQTYKQIDKVICCSHFMESKIRENANLKGRTLTLHNFTSKNETPFFEKGKYVLYFGRYAKEKGIVPLLNAIKELPDIDFVFAGAGDMEKDIEALPNVKNVGFKSGKELDSLIGNALFSVYPSIWYENCPFSIMESISLGTPVIASDIGGIPELIENSSTGILTEPNNAKSLKKAISYLYSNKNELSVMSKNCNSTRFDSIYTYTDKLLKIYAE